MNWKILRQVKILYLFWSSDMYISHIRDFHKNLKNASYQILYIINIFAGYCT